MNWNEGKRSQIIRSVKTNERVVALTFDDGPDPDFSLPKLDILDRFQAEATFFMLGVRMESDPALVKETVRRGHEIGNHTFNHPNLTEVNKWEVFRQIVTTRNIQVRLKAFWPYFRPPFGFVDETVLQVAGETGYPSTFLWNIDPRDWQQPDADVIAQRVLSNLQPGAIILLHDWVEQTVEALPVILNGMKKMGYRSVSLSKLLALDGKWQDRFRHPVEAIASPVHRGVSVFRRVHGAPKRGRPGRRWSKKKKGSGPIFRTEAP